MPRPQKHTRSGKRRPLLQTNNWFRNGALDGKLEGKRTSDAQTQTYSLPWRFGELPYDCRDGTKITVRVRTARRRKRQHAARDGNEQNDVCFVLQSPRSANRIAYENETLRVLVSGVELSRDMGEVTGGADGIAKVSFPDSVAKVSENAFRQQTRLRLVCFNKYLRTLEANAFRDCSGLANVSLPDGLQIIGRRCFSGAGLRGIAIPRGVTVLGEAAFFSCRQLEQVTFCEDGSLHTIQQLCFMGSGLREVRTPPSLRTLGASAFGLCNDLKHVVLGEGLEVLEPLIFSGSRVVSVVLPSTIREIRMQALEQCVTLSTVHVAAGEIKLPFNFVRGEVCGKLIVGPDVTEIEYSPAYRYFDLKEIIFNDSRLERIGPNAF